MARITDGVFTTAGQNGAKEISLPLQSVGQNFATLVTRRYNALVEYYQPLRYQSNAFTQLLIYSDDLSNVAWTKGAATATANATTDTEGLTNASKLAEDATTAAHGATQTLAVASGALSFGVLAQQAERKFLRLRLNNATDGDLATAVFDLNAGVVTVGTGAIKKLLNGWYWCKITGTATIANSKVYCDLSADGVTWNYAGTAGSGVYLFRATAIPAAPAGNFPAIITTAATRAVTVPAVDPDDPLAFLIDESGPDSGGAQYGVAQWARKYANVPAPLTRYSTVALTKPTPASLAPTVYATVSDHSHFPYIINGNAYSYGGYYWWPAGSMVFGPILSPSWVQTKPTNGTFTLTYKTSTTGALAYNAADATVAAAVNALADVITDGLTFTASNTLTSTGNVGLTVTLGTLTTRLSMDASSLTPAASNLALTATATTGSQIFVTAYRATITAHGFTVGKPLFQPSGGPATAFYYGTEWAIIDANTVAANSALTNVGFWLRSYTPGASRIGTRIIQSFYLPGFTPGITTGADIPIPAPLINDATFLAAIVANTTGFIAYDAQPVDFWNAPIYQQQVIQLNATGL